MKTLLSVLLLFASHTTYAAESYVKVTCHTKTTREMIVNKYMSSVRISENKLEGFLYSPMSSQEEVAISVDLSNSTCIVKPHAANQMR